VYLAGNFIPHQFAAACRASIKSCRSGLARLTLVDPTNYPCQIGGEVQDWDPTTYMDRKVARWSVSLIAIIGIIAATLAGATIWLLVTDPVRGADAVSSAMATGDVEPFMRAIGSVIFNALQGLFGYL